MVATVTPCSQLRLFNDIYTVEILNSKLANIAYRRQSLGSRLAIPRFWDGEGGRGAP